MVYQSPTGKRAICNNDQALMLTDHLFPISQTPRPYVSDAAKYAKQHEKHPRCAMLQLRDSRNSFVKLGEVWKERGWVIGKGVANHNSLLTVRVDYPGLAISTSVLARLGEEGRVFDS